MSDLTPAKTVEALVKKGELLEAVDEARRLTADMSSDEDRWPVQIEEVIALARMASLDEAMERFRAYSLEQADTTRARSLFARLDKDLAFAAPEGPERTELLRRSRERYHEEALLNKSCATPVERKDFEYNAVNAISLASLTDDLAAVDDLTRMMLRDEPDDTYWSWASHAELMLATKAPEAEIVEALKKATRQRDAFAGYYTTTLTQLERLSAPEPVRAALTPRCVAHYSGHMIAAPDQEFGRVLARNEAELQRRVWKALSDLDPAVIYGSLACGVDIIAVEWAIAHDRDVRIYIPYALEDFIRASVSRGGPGWDKRARACLDHERCKTAFITDHPAADQDWCYAAASSASMGAAILHAERLRAEPVQLLVWDAETGAGVAGADADRRMWEATGRRSVKIDVADLGAKEPASETAPSSEAATGDGPDAAIAVRAPKALVFGDVKNFSKLKETQLPVFVERIMGCVGAALKDVADSGAAADFSNTWGDGVFAVFSSPAAAATFALRLQRRIAEAKADLQGAKRAALDAIKALGADDPALDDARMDLLAVDLPQELAIRLGLHYGVVYPLPDPVRGGTNYFGEAVSRAARVEPITDAGAIFVTEEFAAGLALDPARAADAEYVGERDTAKAYGRFRLYRLKERPD